MIYLVRHGQTEFNRDGRLQGHCDSPLTALGVEQAGRVGALLKSLIANVSDWSIASSSLGRAVSTAKIIADIVGIGEVGLDERLREIGMGSWDGLTLEDIDMVSPGAAEGATRYDIFFRSPDGERFDGFAARLQNWLDEALGDGRPRICVSHGVAGRVLRGLYLGQTFDEFIRLPAPQDAIFCLDGGVIERIDCAPAALAPAPAER
jgi:broad specificity phosphatase PhoE